MSVAPENDPRVTVRPFRPKPKPNGSAGSSASGERFFNGHEHEAAEEQGERIAFKTLGAFCAEYQPLAYVVDPIIRTASIYTLTARTGSGKTALAVILALAVVTGRRELLGMDVEAGAVAYLAFENPDDVRMRFMVAAYSCGIDPADIGDRLVVLDARAKPEAMAAELRHLAERQPFVLTILDTFAAGFDGADINDNVQAGEYVRRLRPMTQVAGLPALVIAAHPVKNASEDNLVPYGGGAILNEVDGNLCLSKKADTGNTVLHWQGKFRGLEFAPVHFRFDTVSAPSVIDKHGRQVLLPVLRPCTAQDVEEREAVEVNVDRKILECISAQPAPTVREISDRVGRGKSVVQRKLDRFAKEGLAAKVLGSWQITPKGHKAL